MTVLQDVRLAFRRLRQAPFFTLFAVASLAVGIGVSTAIYSAVRTLFWMPLAIPHAEDVIAVSDGGVVQPAMSWLDFTDLRSRQTTFQSLSAASVMRAGIAGGGGAEMAVVEPVSGDYFTTMAIAPRVGRLLRRGDEAARAPVVVLSEAFWHRAFQGDAGVVGRVVKIAGEPYEVAGVVRGAFHGLLPFFPADAWIPATAMPATEGTLAAGDRLGRRFGPFAVWGRLKSGVPVDRAGAEVAVIARQIEAAFPSRRAAFSRRWTTTTKAVDFVNDNGAGGLAGLIVIAVAMVLLIACTNLANLSLAKGTARSQELAVRTALGASRGRLVRELVVETALVTIAGGIAGLWLLRALLDFFSIDLPLFPQFTMPFRPQADIAVLAAAATAMILAVLVAGVWPALQSTREDVRRGLGAGLGTTPPKWRLHRNLVAWQVAGSVALFLVAAMAVKVIGTIGRMAPDAAHEDLAVAQVEFSLNGRTEEEMRRTTDAIAREARAQAGVQSVAVSNALPFGSGFFRSARGNLTRPDQPFSRTRDVGRSSAVVAAGPEFPATVGLRLLRGRWFASSDQAASPHVAVVSEKLARDLFQSVDVVGRQVLFSRTARPSDEFPPETLEIAGVSQNPDASVRRTRGEVLFVPFTQRYEAGLPVIITARAANPSRAAEQLRAVIRRVDPDLAISAAGTGSVIIAGPFFVMRVLLVMSISLGALALTLAMAGLFGVLTHVVERRTREIGIRIAIGADRPQVFRLILRDGLSPVAKGLAVGLVTGAGASLVVQSRMSPTLWSTTLWSMISKSISPVDPWPMALIVCALGLSGLVACALPAIRAARVDPNVALRDL